MLKYPTEHLLLKQTIRDSFSQGRPSTPQPHGGMHWVRRILHSTLKIIHGNISCIACTPGMDSREGTEGRRIAYPLRVLAAARAGGVESISDNLLIF